MLHRAKINVQNAVWIQKPSVTILINMEMVNLVEMDVMEFTNRILNSTVKKLVTFVRQIVLSYKKTSQSLMIKLKSRIFFLHLKLNQL